MRKYIITGIAFFLITGPGMVVAWLSLLDRFQGENEPVSISIGTWYDILFPILGFAVLVIGIWWTRDRLVPTAPPTESSLEVATLPPVTQERESPSELATYSASDSAVLTRGYLVGLLKGTLPCRVRSALGLSLGDL